LKIRIAAASQQRPWKTLPVHKTILLSHLADAGSKWTDQWAILVFGRLADASLTIMALFFTAILTAHIHPPRWAGFAIGRLNRVVGQSKGGALAVECVHIAKGADVAELWHDTLGLSGLARQGGAQASGGEESNGPQPM